MARVALNKISPRLPAIPITLAELRGIWDAVGKYPITGNQVLDFRLLVMTGLLESGFSSGTIMPPNNESSALGYFQIIKSVRNSISRRIGIPWDNSVSTQAKFAAYGYSELANMLRRRSIPAFKFSSDPLANLLLNTRFRYIVGTGSRYLNHRDAKSFWSRTMKYYPFLAQGDNQNVLPPKVNINNTMNDTISISPIAAAQIRAATAFTAPFTPSVPVKHTIPIFVLSPKFNKEFDDLPESVKFTFWNIVNSFRDGKAFISSILTSFNGQPRTKKNGVNHAQGKAIDFVITPFSSPYFINQEGMIRSPNFHWNKYLIDHLTALFESGLIAASVLIEPDHIHIDSNHQPGVSVKHGDKSIYSNLSDHCSTISIDRIT